MRKILYTGFLVLLLGSITPIVNAAAYYTNYNNIEMTEQEYSNLVELGFTESEIYQMSNQEFLDNKDLNATLVSEKEEYYKVTTITKNGVSTSTSEVITENQYQQEKNSSNLQTRSGYDGIVTTDYKRMRTSITQVNSNEYRYKVTLTWLNIPSTRSHDIIAIGFEPSLVQLNSSVYFQQNYTNSSGSHSPVTCIPIAGSNGGSAVFKLPTGTLSALSSYLYYDVIKADEDFTVTEMLASGDYAHATSSISETNAQKHSVNHADGIVLNSSIASYYDGINIAQASWYGTW